MIPLNSLVIKFDAMKCLVVKVKAHEMNGKKVWEACELEPLVSIAELVAAGTLVLVVPRQQLWGDKGSQGLLHTLVCSVGAEGPDGEGHVQVCVFPSALKAALKTLDIVLHLTLVEVVDKVSLVGVFEALLQSIKHHPTQLLDIVLLPRLAAVPPKTSGQFCCLHCTLLGCLLHPNRNTQVSIT